MKEELTNQPTAKPTRKVEAGLSAGAVSTIIVTALKIWGIEIEGDLVAALVTVAIFLTSYLTKEYKQS